LGWDRYGSPGLDIPLPLLKFSYRTTIHKIRDSGLFQRAVRPAADQGAPARTTRSQPILLTDKPFPIEELGVCPTESVDVTLHARNLGASVEHTILSLHPDQSYLLPASMCAWLPEGRLAFFMSDVLDDLERQLFYRRRKGAGEKKGGSTVRTIPELLLRVQLYPYAGEVFGSRKITKNLEKDVAFRVLGAERFMIIAP
jgi:hypothetical protein